MAGVIIYRALSSFLRIFSYLYYISSFFCMVAGDLKHVMLYFPLYPASNAEYLMYMLSVLALFACHGSV